MKNSLNIVKHKQQPSLVKQWLLNLLPALLLVVILVLWQVGVKAWHIEKWILPSPSAIIVSFWSGRDLIWQHTVRTLYETALGLGIATIISIFVATLLDLSIVMRKMLYPLLVISQTIPIIAVAPLFLIWFGYGMTAKVVVVVLVCFFPLTVNLADGFAMVDRDALHLLSAMGAGKGQIFRLVKLPATLPFFFSGLRIAGTYSVMGAVIGEWLGADQGLGVLMTRASHSFLTDRVFATILVITALSLLVLLFIEIIAHLVMPWYYRQKEIV